MKASAKKNPATAANPQRGRLSREVWLAGGLDALQRLGTPGLGIDKLAGELGVSKGSFYWHFENYNAFLQALAESWAAVDTDQVRDALGAFTGTPRERLRFMITYIIENDSRKLDLQFRNLAISYPSVQEIVQRVDQTRHAVVQQLFKELGFTGDALKVRVHCFVAVHSLEDGLHAGLSRSELLRLIESRVEFFAGPE